MAKKMPHALDQEKVDGYFLKEICRINKTVFNKETLLDDYMIRYLCMFFDHAYADTTLLDDFVKEFMDRHRTFRPKPEKSISISKASKIFGITRKEFKEMTKNKLARLYRKIARKVHPDTGGSHDEFVELNNAYETLLEKKIIYQ